MSLSTPSMPSAEPPTPSSIYVLGVRIDRISQRQTLDYIDRMIARYRASNKQCPCQQIVTVNTEYIMAAQRNPTFRQCINEATLTVADGAGIVWATHYLGMPTPERVTGTDTLTVLAKRSTERGYRLYLLGAAPGVAEEAACRLQMLAPGLQIAGTYAGSPALAEEDAIIERIAASDADVLFVAYGAPAQDLWIARTRLRLPVAVAMGVGGAFDFISGRQRRAPIWMQRTGLEWLYRLYRQPWRWRRMLALPQYAILVVVKGRKR
jgi:N-acetylglucosaminyldiphosphoundecaprenol N-acetyl-beta-D-mannosaminyltransferase